MNISLFYFLHSFAFQYVWLDSAIRFLAIKLIYILFIAAVIFICSNFKIYNFRNGIRILKESWKQIFYIPVATGLAWFISGLLKKLFHTGRPHAVLSNIHTLFHESGFAFPSGHATTAAALAFAIFFINKRVGYVFMIGAFLVGFARIAAGVHFPVDIIGGYALGFLVAFLLKSR